MKSRRVCEPAAFACFWMLGNIVGQIIQELARPLLGFIMSNQVLRAVFGNAFVFAIGLGLVHLVVDVCGLELWRQRLGASYVTAFAVVWFFAVLVPALFPGVRALYPRAWFRALILVALAGMLAADGVFWFAVLQ